MPQMFRTLLAGGSPPVLYQLSIRSPGAAFAEFATYTFPLSPSQLRAQRPSMSTGVNVKGPAATQGVTKVMDRYGLGPPVFMIEGTTGWDRHASDGYILTGIQSLQLLSAFLSRYATLNEQQAAQGLPDLYTLEFYDFFLSQFWQVEPVGPQEVRQSADRPILAYYRFRWDAVKPAGLPLLGTADALLQILGSPSAVAAANAASTMGAIVAAYSPIGPIGI